VIFQDGDVSLRPGLWPSSSLPCWRLLAHSATFLQYLWRPSSKCGDVVSAMSGTRTSVCSRMFLTHRFLGEPLRHLLGTSFIVHIYPLERPMLPMAYSNEPRLLHVLQPRGFLPLLSSVSRYPFHSASGHRYAFLFWDFWVVLIDHNGAWCLDCPILLKLHHSFSSLGHRSYPYRVFLCPGNHRIHQTHPHDAHLGRFRWTREDL
jgi:hypothetical protein